MNGPNYKKIREELKVKNEIYNSLSKEAKIRELNSILETYETRKDSTLKTQCYYIKAQIKKLKKLD